MATQRVSRLHQRILQWLLADHQRTRGAPQVVIMCSGLCELHELMQLRE